MQVKSALKTFFLCLYLLRVQILGFALLWPISGWVLQGPMFRGLTDIQARQLAGIEGFGAIFIGFLICSTNLVLLYGRDRMAEEPATNSKDAPLHPFLSEGWIRWGTPVFGVLIGILFIINVVRDWTAEKLVYSVITAGVCGYFILMWESIWELFEKRLSRIPNLFKLGPGYCQGDYLHPGHFVALVLFCYFLLAFYIQGLSFGFPEMRVLGLKIADSWETTGSTLLWAVFGVQFVIGILTMLTFYFDRYRIPVTLVLVLLITGTSLLTNPESTFYAQPVQEKKVDSLLSPKQVLAASPSRVIVVAAAGGGIQSSGWTAEVLTRLTEENAEFRQHLKVISGVSGGSVGTVFYLASYPGIWSEKEWTMDEVRRGATSSFLEDVAWGLVYHDLHRLVLPFAFWRSMDRGRALETAFARIAKKDLKNNKTILDMTPNPKCADGLPVIILNATLTDKALPIVFTNSYFPDPKACPEHQRSIRSFWHDYRLDTRLETAARVSASFPYISPASRPEPLLGVDAFVDGGYFDNSGLYSLMAWLEQASEGLNLSEQREVLIITIDAFPEPYKHADRRVNLRWYDQLFLPMTTVVRVRETGQAARTHDEFPLFARSLEPAMKIDRILFRYVPSPRCAMAPPPLSWRLTQSEKECLTEGWSEDGVRESRLRVKKWLEMGPQPDTENCFDDSSP